MGLVIGVEPGRLLGLVAVCVSGTADGVVGLDGVWSMGGAVWGVEVVAGAGVAEVGVVGVDVGAFDLGDDGADIGIGLIAGVGVAVGGGVDVGVVVGVGFAVWLGGAVAVAAVAVDVSEVLGRLVSDVWVGLFVGVAG
ncbi:hypothetical protein [Nocardia salmonicida]|uniref:hypothetical protein n=1 Tax=Nocardia salmonicida TaxID=53431 RepID=UPI002E2A848F|nr:hypothetical protein [Nocardia salmonicida]